MTLRFLRHVTPHSEFTPLFNNPDLGLTRVYLMSSDGLAGL